MIYCVFNRMIFEWQRCELLCLTNYGALVFNIDVGNIELIQTVSLKILKVY